MDVGTVYHGLTLLHFCGSGAFGEVYQCRDLSGKILAVKIISKHKLGDAWKRELRGVTHYRTITETSSALLQIYHVGEDEESFFYTMEAADSRSKQEYIPDTLAARLQDGAIPPDKLFPILTGIFLGIKTIHDAGFTHRDIKPDNILFVNGQPKLGDIGLVSSLSATLTQMAGTLEFLPPELRTGEDTAGTDRDARQMSDLYAFGKIIYCAATGLEATQFPTVPESLKLSQPVKYFLRLSHRLCDREPIKRLSCISTVERQLAEVEQKLLYGETVSERICYCCRTEARNLVFLCQLCVRWCIHHWLTCLIILLSASCITWYFWPEPPFDITKQKTKQYINQELKLSMEIPVSWEILTSMTFRKMLDKSKVDPEKNPQVIKQLNAVQPLLEFGAELIICGYDRNAVNQIVIQSLPVQGIEFLAIPNDELRVGIQNVLQGELGLPAKVYTITKTMVAGYTCKVVDLSQAPGTRTINYIFPLANQTVAIGMTATDKTFHELNIQFKSVLETLKIEE